jgi:hypothetical protein
LFVKWENVMQDLEQRYFERIAGAQTRFNDALDAARAEHDIEVNAAREELNDRASQRFAVLFGRTAAPPPSEAVKGLIEDMIVEVMNSRLATIKTLAPPEETAPREEGEG